MNLCTKAGGAERTFDGIQGAAGNEEQEMRRSLEDERVAVLDFLYTVIDKTLTPVQVSVAGF